MFNNKKTLNEEKLELTYDLHSICEALMYDSADAAAAFFAERVKAAYGVAVNANKRQSQAILKDNFEADDRYA